MSQNTIDNVRGTIITTDDTATTLASWTVPDDSSVVVQATVVARNTSTGAIAGFYKFAAGKNVGGNVSLVGSILDIISAIKDLSMLTASCTLDVSGTDIRVRVTGIAATTIEWMVALTAFNN